MNLHTLFLHIWQFRYGVLLFSGNSLNDRSRKLIGVLMRNFNVYDFVQVSYFCRHLVWRIILFPWIIVFTDICLDFCFRWSLISWCIKFNLNVLWHIYIFFLTLLLSLNYCIHMDEHRIIQDIGKWFRIQDVLAKLIAVQIV